MLAPHRVRVKNFGPIAEASFELRPLTVFVGPSNTGKSYLAGLLYALHRAFGPTLVYGRVGPLFARRRVLWPDSGTFQEELRQAANAWLADCNEAVVADTYAIPDEIARHIDQILAESPLFNRHLASEIARCFGVDDPRSLRRHGSRSAAPALEVSVPHGAQGYARFATVLDLASEEAKVEIRAEPLRLSGTQFRRLRAEATVVPHEEDWEAEVDPDAVIRYLTQAALRRAFEPVLRHNAYYLPADRTGVMHSHHVVVSTLLQRASLAGIRRFDQVPMLSGVMADFLDVLVTQISQLEGRRSPSTTVPDVAAALEQDVLEGRVVVNAGEVQYPAFSYRPIGWRDDIPLMRASSMVSELAPVILYLRYIVRPGDLLIIEEPESHLHPAKQAAFARGLVSIVNSGVRVVMTTHSEWFLEQIGNLVRASGVPPIRRGSIEQVLDPKTVGAWFFRRPTEGKGSTVAEIQVDPDTGLYPTDFGAVSDALYNEHVAIANLLEGAEQ